MIVIGVDVHKHSLTAVAVDELGRLLGELSTASGNELLVWSKRLAGERLRALEDCRHVSRNLEQTLLADGERLVRVPPRLTAPQRRGAAGRAASRMRSTRSRSPGRPCASRASIVPVPRKRRCES